MSEIQKLLKQQSREAAATLAQVDLAIECLRLARDEIAEVRRLVINQLFEKRDDDKAQQTVAS